MYVLFVVVFGIKIRFFVLVFKNVEVVCCVLLYSLFLMILQNWLGFLFIKFNNLVEVERKRCGDIYDIIVDVCIKVYIICIYIVVGDIMYYIY